MDPTRTFKYVRQIAFMMLPLVCLAELTLRMLPACDGPFTVFDRASHLLKFDGGRQREGFETEGNLAQRKFRWHINNAGWNSGYDYRTDDPKPVIAIIGNSYVEGFANDYRNSLGAMLQARLGPDYDCYSFGYSGSYLGQYLNISRYVARNFHPRIMIFPIFENDVRKSILAPGEKPQYKLMFQRTPAGIQEAPIREFVPHWAVRMYGKLALVRYFKLNKQQEYSEQALGPDDALGAEETRDIAEVTDYAFGHLRRENPGTAILIVLDAPRADIYQGRIRPRRLQSRAMVARCAARYGFQVLDLTGPMAERYRMNHQILNYANNYHWNEYGNQVVTSEILRKLTGEHMVALSPGRS